MVFRDIFEEPCKDLHQEMKTMLCLSREHCIIKDITEQFVQQNLLEENVNALKKNLSPNIPDEVLKIKNRNKNENTRK